ncbi:hypothetical protein M404DRAFT_19657 [Pisolithus tinctorius Marx 270]|uniref:Uncharacterized protein n=1 Tax=Pisolithus tinctorius Marx 270 TaxID=870435 RepID=A0A0C3PVT7_PISTI|nr:hypothetical protein M404DRAFT_19657 [Pisolithus tinctorius Marx 270]
MSSLPTGVPFTPNASANVPAQPPVSATTNNPGVLSTISQAGPMQPPPLVPVGQPVATPTMQIPSVSVTQPSAPTIPQHIATSHIVTPIAQSSTVPIIPPPVPPKTPLPPPGNSGSSAQQLLAAYILMSPSSKTTVDNLIDAERVCSSSSHWSNVHRPLLFDLNEHTPVVTPNDTAVTHQRCCGHGYS